MSKDSHSEKVYKVKQQLEEARADIKKHGKRRRAAESTGNSRLYNAKIAGMKKEVLDQIRETKESMMKKHSMRLGAAIDLTDRLELELQIVSVDRSKAIATASDPTQLPTIHDRLPTVVRYKGKWRELMCLWCGSNALKTPPHAPFTTQNMLRHMRRDHPGWEGKFGDCLSPRIFDQEDVTNMQKGKNPKIPLHLIWEDSQVPSIEFYKTHGGFAGNIVEYEEDKFVKVSCAKCNANAWRATRRLFDGLGELREHIGRKHGIVVDADVDPEDEESWYHCVKLTHEEVVALSAGWEENRRFNGSSIGI